MTSSLVFVLLGIIAVVLSEAESFRNQQLKERDEKMSNKPKRDFFNWETGKENVLDKLPKNETGSSGDNRQDQENSIKGKLQKENNTQETPQNDNMQGIPPGLNISQGALENDNMQGAPPGLNISQETQPGLNISQGAPPELNISQGAPGDQKQSSGEEGSSGENGSQQQPNKRNGDDEWEDTPSTEGPPLVFANPVLHEDPFL
nr:uncharacterized protein LOC105335867 [Crassostrea gigas]